MLQSHPHGWSDSISHAVQTHRPGSKRSEEAQRLVDLYRRLNEEFESGGINPKSIEPTLPWFKGLDKPGATPHPKLYSQLPEPLPDNAVRLLALPCVVVPAVKDAAAALVKEVLGLLPKGTKVFANAPKNYHCTVFHTSNPFDTRPNPFKPDGGTDVSKRPGQRRGPTADELQHEQEVAHNIVTSSYSPRLMLESVVMANSGTLLITWTDTGTALHDLRDRLHEAFPGASKRQATIIHTSLLRIVSTDQLPRDVVMAISAVCKRWTEKLHGTVFTATDLWYIRESEFSTIEGYRQVWKLKPPVSSAE